MRKPVVAANWKMFKTRDEALQFIYAVNDQVPSKEIVDTVICAPAIHLRSLVKRQGENIRIGAQNMHYADEGAYTGEISPNMLVSNPVFPLFRKSFRFYIYFCNGETLAI